MIIGLEYFAAINYNASRPAYEYSPDSSGLPLPLPRTVLISWSFFHLDSTDYKPRPKRIRREFPLARKYWDNFRRRGDRPGLLLRR